MKGPSELSFIIDYSSFIETAMKGQSELIVYDEIKRHDT